MARIRRKEDGMEYEVFGIAMSYHGNISFLIHEGGKWMAVRAENFEPADEPVTVFPPDSTDSAHSAPRATGYRGS